MNNPQNGQGEKKINGDREKAESGDKETGTEATPHPDTEKNPVKIAEDSSDGRKMTTETSEISRE